MIEPTALRRRRAPVDRSGDRAVAVGAIGIAVGFLVAAVASLALPVEVRLGPWLPLHLALAGGATAAIAGVMPFFVAAFAAAPPSDVRLRWSALTAVSLGALVVAIGITGREPGLAAAGGLAYLAGIGLTGAALVRPLRGALGASRGIVTRGYLMALGEVGVGALLATLLLAGWPPVMEAWTRIRPAHAWLNLVGFVSLVIATTLLHFFPTVIGARIVAHPSARATVIGLAGGAAVVATGYIVSSDALVRLGAAATLAGGVALALYAGRIWPTRGRWTTDLDWHRFAMGGLVSAIAWFEAGIVVMAGRALVYGAEPIGWSIEAVAAPLVAGWAGIAVLASATHLLPAVGPGDPLGHARQRRLLGRAALGRLVLLDLGVAALAIGLPIGAGEVSTVGVVLVAGGLVSTAALLAGAIALGTRRSPAGDTRSAAG